MALAKTYRSARVYASQHDQSGPCDDASRQARLGARGEGLEASEALEVEVIGRLIQEKNITAFFKHLCKVDTITLPS